MYNSITSVGYLVKDPETRQLNGGKSVTRLRVGISPSNAKTKCFIDLEVWDKLSEIASKYLTKGREFVFSGELAMDTWENKDTGKPQSKYFIRGNNIQFLNSGKKEDGQSSKSGSDTATPTANAGFGSDDEPPF
jgi:single-strand DNA-binding protein